MQASPIFLKRDGTPAPGEPNAQNLVDKFIASKTGNKGSGRLIFAIDATASREPLWDAARGLMGDMFREITTAGGLSAQLVYFTGGLEAPPRCQASGWMTSPVELAGAMARVKCQAGYTQIVRALNHAKTETMRERVGAVVLIGDACEAVGGDDRERVSQAGKALGDLKTPVFAFLEGSLPEAEAGFRAIAEASGGAFGRFDAGASKRLSELLKAAAVYAAGGLTALEKRKDEGSVLLLRQIKG